MKFAGCRFPCLVLLALGMPGCFGTTELSDATADPGAEGGEVVADVPTDAGQEVPEDEDTGGGTDLLADADAPSQVFQLAWFATFRCPSLAGPIYPGVRIPAEKCTVALRIARQPVVKTLEVFVGTGRTNTIPDPAETEEIPLNWGPFPDREIVLRARVIGADGSEDEEIVPVRTMPAQDTVESACMARLDVQVARPDTWETVCGKGRLKATLS